MLRESTNRAWETEMDGGTLRVPKGDAVYEEDMDWVTTAQTMSNGSLSMYLRETARVYNHCRLLLSVHLDDVENESDELKSYVCYTSNENDKLVRDTHLQNIIASIWEQFSELSELYCVNIPNKAMEDEESLDDVLQKTIHNFVTGLELFI
ncbi:hypothetical protein BWQ96_07163 [Gracilariopsis chorda]|uniref:Uncharacterized protein n=1 Tax=Gracilariopsis chorda TaxID=448386 RepID=A0A2V3IM03_9FLOR|nr:hypothetical protein BWQ96_07163 [Gracilariopsis chorda]|eukprot:PXF43077.1 hypothetical protein BWQ96_07163 [Gracilariopsis chorda]